jgi:hypothetical protein
MGSEDGVEQSFGRPFRQCNGMSKRACELTSSIIPRGTSFHHSVELEYSPVAIDPELLAASLQHRSASFIAGMPAAGA